MSELESDVAPNSLPEESPFRTFSARGSRVRTPSTGQLDERESLPFTFSGSPTSSLPLPAPQLNINGTSTFKARPQRSSSTFPSSTRSSTQDGGTSPARPSTGRPSTGRPSAGLGQRPPFPTPDRFTPISKSWLQPDGKFKRAYRTAYGVVMVFAKDAPGARSPAPDFDRLSHRPSRPGPGDDFFDEYMDIIAAVEELQRELTMSQQKAQNEKKRADENGAKLEAARHSGLKEAEKIAATWVELKWLEWEQRAAEQKKMLTDAAVQVATGPAEHSDSQVQTDAPPVVETAQQTAEMMGSDAAVQAEPPELSESLAQTDATPVVEMAQQTDERKGSDAAVQVATNHNDSQAQTDVRPMVEMAQQTAVPEGSDTAVQVATAHNDSQAQTDATPVVEMAQQTAEMEGSDAAVQAGPPGHRDIQAQTDAPPVVEMVEMAQQTVKGEKESDAAVQAAIEPPEHSDSQAQTDAPPVVEMVEMAQQTVQMKGANAAVQAATEPSEYSDSQAQTDASPVVEMVEMAQQTADVRGSDASVQVATEPLEPTPRNDSQAQTDASPVVEMVEMAQQTTEGEKKGSDAAVQVGTDAAAKPLELKINVTIMVPDNDQKPRAKVRHLEKEPDAAQQALADEKKQAEAAQQAAHAAAKVDSGGKADLEAGKQKAAPKVKELEKEEDVGQLAPADEKKKAKAAQQAADAAATVDSGGKADLEAAKQKALKEREKEPDAVQQALADEKKQAEVAQQVGDAAATVDSGRKADLEAGKGKVPNDDPFDPTRPSPSSTRPSSPIPSPPIPSPGRPKEPCRDSSTQFEEGILPAVQVTLVIADKDGPDPVPPLPNSPPRPDVSKEAPKIEHPRGEDKSVQVSDPGHGPIPPDSPPRPDVSKEAPKIDHPRVEDKSVQVSDPGLGPIPPEPLEHSDSQAQTDATPVVEMEEKAQQTAGTKVSDAAVQVATEPLEHSNSQAQTDAAPVEEKSQQTAKMKGSDAAVQVATDVPPEPLEPTIKGSPDEAPLTVRKLQHKLFEVQFKLYVLLRFLAGLSAISVKEKVHSEEKCVQASQVLAWEENIVEALEILRSQYVHLQSQHDTLQLQRDVTATAQAQALAEAQAQAQAQAQHEVLQSRHDVHLHSHQVRIGRQETDKQQDDYENKGLATLTRHPSNKVVPEPSSPDGNKQAQIAKEVKEGNVYVADGLGKGRSGKQSLWKCCFF